MNKLIDIGIYSVLFISGIVLFQSPFEFYITYIPILILLPFFMARYAFPVKLMYFFVPLLFFGLINVYFGDNTIGEFIKIFANILVSSLFFYYVFEYYNRDVKRIFETYMKVCIWVSILGIIQLVSYWVHFRPGYDYGLYGFNKWSFYPGGIGLRINSVFSEPSYYGATIGPAFFIAFTNILFRKRYFIDFNRSLLIIIPYILTFSTVAYLGIFVTLLLLVLNFGVVRYIAIAIPAGILIFNVMYNNAEEFRVRIDGLKALYIDHILDTEGLKAGEKNLYKMQKLLSKVHGSSFVQFNNYKVATENFASHPFFGTGLGSHKVAFDRYNVLDKLGNIYKFNTADANSMLLRIISEMGLYGLIFMYLFIRRYFIRIPPEMNDNNIWLISNAALVMIILQLARQGNYTYNGFIFYMWLYYYSFTENTEQEEALAKQEDASPAINGQQPLLEGN